MRQSTILFIIVVYFCSLASAYGRNKNEKATVDVKEIQRHSPGLNRDKSQKNQKNLALSQNMEEKLITGIAKTILYLEKTASELPKNSANRFGLLMKVQNLRLEQATYEAFQEQADYDRKWEKWESDERKGIEPKLSSEKSRYRWNQVIADSKLILKDFPKTKNVDTIHFNLALALQFLGQEKEAASSFKQMITAYPKSPLLGDVYFFLGEYFFDHQAFKQAIDAYQKTVSFQGSKRVAIALFKMGWALFNLASYQSALKAWMKVVDYAKRVPSANVDKIMEEALKDMAFAFVELGKIEEAINYYEDQKGKDYIPGFLKQLAQTLTDRGDFEQAVAILRRLQKMQPHSEETLNAQREIVALYYDIKNIPACVKEVGNLLGYFSSQGKWAERLEKKIDDLDQKNTETALYYAKMIHKSGQKTADKNYLSQAKEAYLNILRSFPEGIFKAELTEYIADIDYFYNKFDTSGMLYMKLTQMGPDKAVTYNEKGQIKEKIHERSAKNMLDAFNKALAPELAEMVKIKPDFNAGSKPISQNSQNFIESCELYAKYYANDQISIKNCRIFTSEIYYRLAHKDEAKKRLLELAIAYSESKEGPLAVENLIPLYADQKKELAIVAAKLLQVPAYKTAAIGNKLNNLIQGFKLDEIKEEKDPIKRAKLYEAEAKSGFQAAGNSPEALLTHAAANYLQAGSIAGAINSYASILNKYPNSEVAAPSLLQLAKLYERTFDYLQAANLYEAYSLKYSQNKEAPAAAQRACLILIAIDSLKASDNCFKFAAKMPDIGKEPIFMLIQNNIRTKKYEQARDAILFYLSLKTVTPNERILANYKLYKMLPPDSSDATRLRKQILDTAAGQNITGEALRYLGEMLSIGANQLLHQYQSMNLEGGSLEKLQASIQKMSQALTHLEQNFAPVFSIKDSYAAIGAFYYLGSMYEHFGRQLASPPSIQGAKQEDVKAQLKASVDQITAKSLEYYKAGFDTMQKYDVLHPLNRSLFDALARQKSSPLTFEDAVLDPDFLSSGSGD